MYVWTLISFPHHLVALLTDWLLRLQVIDLRASPCTVTQLFNQNCCMYKTALAGRKVHILTVSFTSSQWTRQEVLTILILGTVGQ